jgi:hypothetical protein
MSIIHLHFHGATWPVPGQRTATIGSFVIYQDNRMLPSKYGTAFPAEESAGEGAPPALAAGYLGLIGGLRTLHQTGYTGPVSVSSQIKPIISQLSGEVEVPPDLQSYYDGAMQWIDQFEEVDFGHILWEVGLAERVSWDWYQRALEDGTLLQVTC